jgi:hypothetical protein
MTVDDQGGVPFACLLSTVSGGVVLRHFHGDVGPLHDEVALALVHLYVVEKRAAASFEA